MYHLQLLVVTVRQQLLHTEHRDALERDEERQLFIFMLSLCDCNKTLYMPSQQSPDEIKNLISADSHDSLRKHLTITPAAAYMFYTLSTSFSHNEAATNHGRRL